MNGGSAFNNTVSCTLALQFKLKTTKTTSRSTLICQQFVGYPRWTESFISIADRIEYKSERARSENYTLLLQ